MRVIADMRQPAHFGAQCVSHSERFFTAVIFSTPLAAAYRAYQSPTRTSPARGSRTSPCPNRASCPVAHVLTTDFSLSVQVCLRPSGPRTVACHFPDGSLRI
jgi:hypothetical protein